LGHANFGLQAGHAEDRYYYVPGNEIDDPYLDSTGELKNLSKLGIRDEWRKLDIVIKTETPCVFWRTPVDTISLSEAGFERVYQNSVVFPNIRFKLHDSWQYKLSLQLKKI